MYQEKPSYTSRCKHLRVGRPCHDASKPPTNSFTAEVLPHMQAIVAMHPRCSTFICSCVYDHASVCTDAAQGRLERLSFCSICVDELNEMGKERAHLHTGAGAAAHFAALSNDIAV
jgi:hypothetical protein